MSELAGGEGCVSVLKTEKSALKKLGKARACIIISACDMPLFSFQILNVIDGLN